MGERLILKGYRRLRAGRSPELEMGLYLTEVVHYAELRAAGGRTRVRATRTASRGCSRCCRPTSPIKATAGPTLSSTCGAISRNIAPRPPATRCRSMRTRRISRSMRVLAVRTAELHRALATRTKDRGVRPRAADARRFRGLSPACGRARRKSALALLKAHLSRSRRAGSRQGQRGAGRSGSPAEAHRAPASSEEPKGRKIRIHGDYHLGQVLVTRNDFVIVDFEGEPGHSLEERRAKQSPLRDVAGMLRSFSYVRAQRAAERRARRGRIREARAPGARLGRRKCAAPSSRLMMRRRAALSLYGALTPGSGLLGLFELEKALYELRYELGNRPGWAGIPLQGILESGAI